MDWEEHCWYSWPSKFQETAPSHGRRYIVLDELRGTCWYLLMQLTKQVSKRNRDDILIIIYLEKGEKLKKTYLEKDNRHDLVLEQERVLEWCASSGMGMVVGRLVLVKGLSIPEGSRWHGMRLRVEKGDKRKWAENQSGTRFPNLGPSPTATQRNRFWSSWVIAMVGKKDFVASLCLLLIGSGWESTAFFSLALSYSSNKASGSLNSLLHEASI